MGAPKLLKQLIFIEKVGHFYWIIVNQFHLVLDFFLQIPTLFEM